MNKKRLKVTLTACVELDENDDRALAPLVASALHAFVATRAVRCGIGNGHEDAVELAGLRVALKHEWEWQYWRDGVRGAAS